MLLLLLLVGLPGPRSRLGLHLFPLSLRTSNPARKPDRAQLQAGKRFVFSSHYTCCHWLVARLDLYFHFLIVKTFRTHSVYPRRDYYSQRQWIDGSKKSLLVTQSILDCRSLSKEKSPGENLVFKCQCFQCQTSSNF